jgi:hypothetical protein
MARLLKFIKNSLIAQFVTAILLLNIITIFTALFFEIRQNRQELLRILEERSVDNAEIMRLMADRALARGNDADTQEVFSLLADKFPQGDFSVAGMDGLITYSTRQKAIKEPFSRVFNPELTAIYKKAFEPDAGQGKLVRLVEENNRRKFMSVTPIENSPECYHCHGWSNPLLGASAALSDVEDEMNSFFWLCAAKVGFGILLAILLTLFVAGFLRLRFFDRLKSGAEQPLTTAEKLHIQNLILEAKSILNDYGEGSAMLVGQVGHTGAQIKKWQELTQEETDSFLQVMAKFEELNQSAAATVVSVREKYPKLPDLYSGHDFTGLPDLNDGAENEGVLAEYMQKCIQSVPAVRKQAEVLIAKIEDANHSTQVIQELANRINLLALTTAVAVAHNEPEELARVEEALRSLADNAIKYAADMHRLFGALGEQGKGILPVVEMLGHSLDTATALYLQDAKNRISSRQTNKEIFEDTLYMCREVACNTDELQKIADRAAVNGSLFLQTSRTLNVAEAAAQQLMGIAEKLKKTLEDLEYSMQVKREKA